MAEDSGPSPYFDKDVADSLQMWDSGLWQEGQPRWFNASLPSSIAPVIADYVGSDELTNGLQQMNNYNIDEFINFDEEPLANEAPLADTTPSAPVVTSNRLAMPTLAVTPKAQSPLCSAPNVQLDAGKEKKSPASPSPAMAPVDFYGQTVTLEDPAGETCTGTYRDLQAKYPKLRKLIALQHAIWKKQHQSQSSPFLSASLPANQITSQAKNNDGVDAMPSSNVSSKSMVALLRPIPAQRGKAATQDCTMCGRVVASNGKNDGIHCTMCFNKKNKEIKKLNESLHSQQGSPAVSYASSEFAPPTMMNGNGPQVGASTSNHSTPVGGINSTLPGFNNPLFTASSSPDAQTHDHYGSSSPMSDAEEHGSEMGELQSAVNEHDELEHESVEAAREYIMNPPQEALQRFEVEDDDWQEVKNYRFRELCNDLFFAIHYDPDHASSTPDAEEELDYSGRHHDRMKNSVRKALATNEQRKLVKARVICTIDEAVRMHEKGVWKFIYPKGKSTRGVNLTLACLERIRKIISLAKYNKSIAMDIISGRYEKVILAPDETSTRKGSNLTTNETRSIMQGILRKFGNAEITAEEAMKALQKKESAPGKGVKNTNIDPRVKTELPASAGLVHDPAENTNIDPQLKTELRAPAGYAAYPAMQNRMTFAPIAPSHAGYAPYQQYYSPSSLDRNGLAAYNQAMYDNNMSVVQTGRKRSHDDFAADGDEQMMGKRVKFDNQRSL